MCCFVTEGFAAAQALNRGYQLWQILEAEIFKLPAELLIKTSYIVTHLFRTALLRSLLHRCQCQAAVIFIDSVLSIWHLFHNVIVSLHNVCRIPFWRSS